MDNLPPNNGVSMKTILAMILAIAIAAPLQAQQIMDGSAADQELSKQMAEALIGKATDPYSAQFAKLKQKGADVCGLINLKNQNGGYTGFHPFLFSQGQMFLDQTTPC
ncbi:hypothetical protein [Rhizobium laguerreae]|uniref:hypothetical protein n=1 Tax=Rhizobium laguerreae TaxID=1076926 RepID=UPI001441270A|nr:hypothetical protein [Rhizobium laguerreae]NKM69162.1 hypothetical protein [Rhizobium laguerreae]